MSQRLIGIEPIFTVSKTGVLPLYERRHQIIAILYKSHNYIIIAYPFFFNIKKGEERGVAL